VRLGPGGKWLQNKKNKNKKYSKKKGLCDEPHLTTDEKQPI